ncbi:hypothetical protein AB0I60_19130 [Actinosynnema sp. NPDC050436]|uniref:hypothetical protein n=1 Tax=Actinosynnema sp. NPDC050436 TaxID=3155659 RepID=UPI0033F67767
MVKLARALTAATAALAGVAALSLGAGTAQASSTDPVYLLTTDNVTCGQIGTNGTSGGVFSSYECRSGIAGYSVLVRPTSGSFDNVYLATLSLADCASAGDNGVNGAIWSNYVCQLGVAGYSLKVTG